MVDLAKWDTPTLIECENENCGGVSFQDEIEENDWKCPYCGIAISKPE
jgi:rubredoxin